MFDLRNTLPRLLLFFACIALRPCISTYAADSGGISLGIRVETDMSTPVMPRQSVPYRLFVDNKANEAWIRIYALTDSENLEPPFDASYLETADGWIRKGDYLYLTRKAASKSSILAVDGFRVPDADASKDASLKLSVRAEGIDVRVVTPDFSLDDPWKGHTPDTVTDYYDNSRSSGSGSGGAGNSGGSGGSGNSTRNSSRADALSAHNRYNAPTANAASSSGVWKCLDTELNIWQYLTDSGSYAKDGWYYIYNNFAGNGGKTQWFYFDKSGYMQTGWTAMNTRDWYHLHEISDGSLGALSTGWYSDMQDNKRYYLDTVTGLMQSGWQNIGGKSYYFASLSEIPGPNWVYTLISGTSFGKWLYNTLNVRSYGSMYIDETTPDGSKVDASGAKIG